jgi:chromosome segregation ATPase
MTPDISSNITTIFITLLTVAGSAGAWRFYEAKLKQSTKEREDTQKEQNLFRDNLRERISVLEARLEEREKEKEVLQGQLTNLIAQLAEYKVRLEFLERENTALLELKKKFILDDDN